MGFTTLPTTNSTPAASVVTVTPAGNLSSNNVQSALEELQTDVDTRAVISSMTAATMWSTSGTDGQIIFNSTYKANFLYSVDRWVPIGEPGSRYGVTLADEFLSNSVTGALNWTNSGTVVVAAQASANHPGVFTLRNATSGARSAIGLRADSVVLNATDDLYIEWLVSIPTLATVAEDFVFTCGLNDNSTYDVNGACTDGVYFSYNRAVNGANWNCHTIANSVQTNTTNLSSAIVAGSWYRLGILIRGTTSADFFVNGVNVKQHTTNIPSGASRATGFQAKLDKTGGTGNSDAQIDTFRAWMFFTTPRSS